MGALDQIKAEAAAIEAPAGVADAMKAMEAPAASPQPAPCLDEEARRKAEAEEWAHLPATFGSIVCMAIPELAEAYCEAHCLAWGVAMERVAHKYGWSVANIGPWLGLIVATVPMAVPTIVAVRARRAARGDSPAAPAASSGTDAAAAEAKPRAPKVAANEEKPAAPARGR